MLTPKREEAPSALVARLMAWPRPSVVVPFPVNPGMDPFDVRLLIPSNSEEEQFKLRALQWFNEWAKKAGVQVDLDAAMVRDIIGDRVAKELLSSAMRLPDPDTTSGKPVYFRMFRGVEELIGEMSADQIAVMWEHFLRLQRDVSPYMAVLTEADALAWVERLKEGISPLAHLGLLDSHELIFMLCNLLRRSLSTGSENPDSQPESSPNTSDLSQPENSAPLTGSSGEQAPNALTRLGELLTPEEAKERARAMRGGA